LHAKVFALRIESLKNNLHEPATQLSRLMSSVKFEVALLCLLCLTAFAIIFQGQLLERTIHYTPATTASSSHLLFSDGDIGGGTSARDLGPLKWDCELRAGNAYPYCGYELFLDRNRGVHGLDLSNLHALTITMMYHGPSTSFRMHLKNFDSHYSLRADDETPKYLRVETDTTPGKLQSTEFVSDDFGVADWWLRKHKLAPQFGHPQFDNITSLIVETGSEAPIAHHAFEVHDIIIRKAVLSEAQWYSLILSVWIVLIVIYLAYRFGNLRRTLAQRRKLEAIALHEAQEAARRDPLTSLLNRRGVTERFEEMAKARRNPFALTVILIDIDHFKKLNDAYGHDFGDEVLSAFAAVLARNVRTIDIAARWGGEEFLIVCADVDRRAAQKIAEKLRSTIEAFDFGKCGRVTASFGLHWAYTSEPELGPLVALADKALYAAKAGGRNCCRLHRAIMSDAA
jgi:diguanylate cyclase (GGDEF)-like protein